jgi:hypothetical protein
MILINQSHNLKNRILPMLYLPNRRATTTPSTDNENLEAVSLEIRMTPLPVSAIPHEARAVWDCRSLWRHQTHQVL